MKHEYLLMECAYHPGMFYYRCSCKTISQCWDWEMAIHYARIHAGQKNGEGR